MKPTAAARSSPDDQGYLVYYHPDVRKVISNGVVWAPSERPERAIPMLLRYDADDLLNGHGYTGPIEEHDEAAK